MNEGIIVIAELIFGRNPEMLQQPREHGKAHKGATAKLINFPALALLHMPAATLLITAVKQIKWQRKML